MSYNTPADTATRASITALERAIAEAEKASAQNRLASNFTQLNVTEESIGVLKQVHSKLKALVDGPAPKVDDKIVVATARALAFSTPRM